MIVNHNPRNNSKYLVMALTVLLVPITLLSLLASTASGDGDQANVESGKLVSNSINRLLVITATNDPSTDTFKRFNRTIEANGLDLIVLGPKSQDRDAQLNEELTDSERFDRLKKALAVYKSEPDLILMVVDNQNTLFNGNKKDILDRFANFKMESKIVFAADRTCWPDAQLESRYPEVQSPGGGDRFLNSALFLGYAPFLWDLLEAQPTTDNSIEISIDSTSTGDNGAIDGKPGATVSKSTSTTSNSIDSFQSYFTNVYLDGGKRKKLGIELDHRARLFQNLNLAEGDVELDFDLDSVRLKNTAHQTEPVVVHGSGTSKVSLSSLGNYLGKSWTTNDGCRWCNESALDLTSTKDEDMPSVLIGLFVEEPTPFIDDFFATVRKLNYPKEKLHLFVHNQVEYHNGSVSKFLEEYGSHYASMQFVNSNDSLIGITEATARNAALDRCIQVKCDYYLALDSIARLDLPDTLRLLIEANKTIVAPLLSRPGKLWSNFWGALTPDGYYARSHDYVELVKQNRMGLWNVPLVMNAYLLDGKFIKACLDNAKAASATATGRDDGGDKLEKTTTTTFNRNLPKLSYQEPDYPFKPVLTFSRQLRSANTFQYLLNTHEFGHLVDPTSFNISATNPDFYELINNMEDWEQTYLHENFTQILEDDTKLEQPCQDVFWFPLVNEKFCNQMIEIMEAYGQWSGGTNDDPRIEGGYESVPTRDIHMKQVGLHRMWLTFLREYVMPVQLKEYIGYEHDPPRAELAFVVRYHPAEQPSLRPHHDASTYTLNIALNTPGVDYEGGGCKFNRYNCSVTQSRRGWALMHPGRLTHYHEGLPVTNGTRYIMVTFIDP